MTDEQHYQKMQQVVSIANNAIQGSAQQIIAGRSHENGDFTMTAEMSQNIKKSMHRSPNWEQMNNQTKESLDMIAMKMARIVEGNENKKDHWDDIIGYAKLITNRLENNTDGE